MWASSMENCSGNAAGCSGGGGDCFCLAESMFAEGVMHGWLQGYWRSVAGLLHAMQWHRGSFEASFRAAAHSAWRVLRTWGMRSWPLGAARRKCRAFRAGMILGACDASTPWRVAPMITAAQRNWQRRSNRCSASLHRTRDMQSPVARTDRWPRCWAGRQPSFAVAAFLRL